MRILSGQFKNRKLLGPPGKTTTRPITGGAKKSLFDILAGRLPDARVLDLYCGTGTLGLEAISRGAERCFFADREKSVLERLRRNIETLQVPQRCVIWKGDVGRRLRDWLAEVDEPVDLAFVDPPYARTQRWDWDEAQRAIFTPIADSLTREGLVTLRLPSQVEPPQKLGPLALRRTKRYGGMTVGIYGRCSESALGGV